MSINALKEKYFRLRRIANSNDDSLKKCLNNLTPEGLEELYNLYDVTGANMKTKQSKINYLLKEIPSQFLDDFRFMMDDKERKLIYDIGDGKSFKIDHHIIHLFTFGFLFINKSDELVVPDELYWFVEAFLKL